MSDTDYTDVPDYYVFDGDEENGVEPRRPTIDDLGGAAFEDDPSDPPIPPHEIGAGAENQNEKVLQGICQTAFTLIIHVEFSSGDPVLAGFTTTSSLLATEDFEFTDNADGNTNIRWPASRLPPRSVGPLVTVNEDVEIDRQRAFMDSDGLGVTVVTKLGATGTDCKFSVYIP